MLNISGYLFSTASFLGVVAVSVDRFLAVHLHLRYQELVTHKRVVVVMIGKWLCSAFVSSTVLWGLPSVWSITESVLAAFGFIVTFVVYTRIYLTIRRHKNQIHSMQVQEVAHSDEIKHFIVLIKSTVSIFYVYLLLLICYLPFLICKAVIRIYGSSIALKQFFLYSMTLIFLNSSLNPVIYCWNMRHVRHAIVNILRKMFRTSNRPLRINYNRSSSVIHVDNWSTLCAQQGLCTVCLPQSKWGERILYINSGQYMAQNFDKSFFLFSHMLIRRGIPSKHLQKSCYNSWKSEFLLSM